MPVAGGAPALALARRLSRSGAAWCWLDGEAPAPGEPATSYLGIAIETRTATRGREREFLTALDRTARGTRNASAAGIDWSAGVAGFADPGVGFASGWVVALGYEFGVALLGLDPAPDDAPPAIALRLDVVIAVTEAHVELRGPDDATIDAWLARHGALLTGEDPGQVRPSDPAPRFSDPAPRPSVPVPHPAAPVPADMTAAPVTPTWRRTDAEYAAEVERCKRAIRDGDAYVLCLTDTAEIQGNFDPLALYERLRGSGAASRGAVIVAGDRALVSASPERFLAVRSGRIQTHPIKGTRPRGATPARDADLARELAADPKERAENLMIVDLMRNDLTRVCEPGTIAVSGFLRVETHPHVHQLVSTVGGVLARGRGITDAIAACFPGGSMTGAPKRRAVEILAELEAAPRGLYSGCFGWIDDGGDAELAMTIRGAELREERALIGAGGGITADSVPEHEVAEKHLKAAALLAAITN